MLNLDASAAFLSCLPIPDYESQAMVNFRFKPAQIKLLNRLKQQQSEGKPIRAMIDKSRRFGGSSLIDGLATTHCCSEENVNAMIVAHRKDSAEALFRVPLTLIKGFSNIGYDIPDPTQRKITFPHPGGDSTLSIATAGDVLGGRGAAFSFLHLSEAANYQGKAPFTSLLSTVPYHRSTALVIESTANKKVGPGQAFYDMWCDAVYGRSEYIAIFIGYIDDVLCRRDALEAADAPLNDDEKDVISLVACKGFCGRCIHCHKALQCVAWRRWAIANLCQGDVDQFHQEYPATWEESFITPQNPAFTRDELRIARAMIREPISIGRLERDISPAADPGRPVILIPDDRSPLKVWKYPEEHKHYYIGADAARGMDNKDYASVFVWEGETGETCARYASRINPESLAELLNFIGIYYFKAMVAIELTGNLGLWCQKVLRDTYQYPNLYKWKGRDDRQPVGYVTRTSIGWETTGRTRPMLLDALRTAIRFGRCKLFDSAMLSQMENAEMIEGKWVVRVGHDDIMMCFPPDTLVSSSTVPVEIPYFKSGDGVWSHNGDYNNVISTSTYRADIDLICIKALGSHRLLKPTPNHRIYVSRYEWLKRGTKTRKKLLVNSPHWKPAGDIKPGDYLLVPKRHNLPASTFTEDQLIVMGWYLAEGSIDKGNTVKFSLHEDEYEVAEMLADIMVRIDPPTPKFTHNRLYNRLAPRIKPIKGKKAINLVYQSDVWASLLLLHCGRYSHHKCLSSDLFYANNLLPLVKAYIDGDGCRATGCNRDHLSVSSMSYGLICQIRQILIDNGIWSTICKGKIQQIYHLHMSPEYFSLLGNMRKYRPVIRKFEKRYVVETDEGFWTPIKSITSEHYVGPVYNLQVSRAETYIAEGYAVHNSAMIGWLIGEQWHSAGMSSSKILDVDNAPSDKSNDDMKVIKSADADVQGMVRNHWHRIMKYNRYGPPKLGSKLEGI